MCRVLETIKFCNCPENLDLNLNPNKYNYVWILQRVDRTDESGLMGMTMLPSKQLDQLKPKFIVQELNSKDLFDFEYIPKENDCLRIERIDRAKTRSKEYLFGEYLDFSFYLDEWRIGGNVPFMYIMKDYKKGKVEIEKIEV